MKYLTLRAANAPALLNQFRTTILFALTLCAAATILVSGPGGRLLMPVKAAILTVCPSGCSATTINGAIALANPGDIITVAAGTYNELVVINKNGLTLLGANADNYPCSGPRNPESIVSTPNGAIQITASGAVVNGFTVQGVTSGLGAGIHATGGNSAGLRYNIIQNNVIGIVLGGANHEVSSNNIRDNNNPGAASGTGIYSDSGLDYGFVGSNCFSGHSRAALNLIGAPVVPGVIDSVQVLGNISTNDAGFSFIGGTNWFIAFNKLSAPTMDAIRLRGGTNRAEVSNNTILNGAAVGISLRNDFGNPNTNLSVTCNRLANLTGAALGVGTGAYTGTLFAEGNWWGCNAGPNNIGCGVINAPDNNVDFTPWKTVTLTSSKNEFFPGESILLDARYVSSGAVCNFSIPVTFASTCGSVNPVTATPDGITAQTLLTARSPGVCTSSATLDNQTLTLNQTVVPLPSPTLTIGTPAGCIGPGAILPVTISVTNQSTTALPFFAGTFKQFGSPPLLLVDPSTCKANVPGTCTSNTATSLDFSGTIPAGQTAVISYKMQVGDAPSNLPLCLNSYVSVQNLFPNISQACIPITCPPAGPGALFPSNTEASGQKAGSVLVYNLFSSSGSAPNAQNTRISMTNTHATQPVAVHLFFVDSASCSVADAFVCLSQNQTASFLMSDFDPGTTGYIVAIASDPATGCPINFNYLIGDEFIKLASGHAANLPAESIAAIPGGLPACNDNSFTAQLNFNGVSYNRLPRVLADSNIPSRQDGNDTLLVINRIGGNLATGAATIGTLFGLVYDDAEAGFSFSLAGGCQLRGSFGATGFPRTVPPLSTIIPTGRTGWMKVYHQTDDIALLGAAINFNANTNTQSGAFSQGHNLHKLALSSAATLTIPVFPPRC